MNVQTIGWCSAHNAAFEELKGKLQQIIRTACRNPNGRTRMHTDTSDVIMETTVT